MDGDVEVRERANPADLTTELRKTQTHARAIARLLRAHGEEIDAEVLDALEAFGQAKMPTARQMYRAHLVGALDHEDTMLLWKRARTSMTAALPAVADMYFEKMEQGNACPYSERLLAEAAKGLGLFTPSLPVSDEEREEALSQGEVRQLSSEQIQQRLRDKIAEGQEQE